MSKHIEALKLALEALEGFIPYLPLKDEAQCNRYDKAITAIKEALAQEQEPWCMKMNGCKTKCEDCPDEPPQRTWVNLTDEDREEIALEVPMDAVCITEAKLKQKNGYAEEKNT